MTHRRPNATVPELMEQYDRTGIMPPEFASAAPQTSARAPRRRGKLKVPTIGNWRRTKKERGLKQGWYWKPPQAWQPSSGHFYVFPAPNRTSQGATQFFYVTDGVQVLTSQHKTKSEAVKALKGLLTGAEAQLRVNPPGWSIKKIHNGRWLVVEGGVQVAGTPPFKRKLDAQEFIDRYGPGAAPTESDIRAPMPPTDPYHFLGISPRPNPMGQGEPPLDSTGAPLHVGDVVMYSRGWLRSTGQYVGEAGFESGPITAIESMGRGSVATVGGDFGGRRVLTVNLVKKGRRHLERQNPLTGDEAAKEIGHGVGDIVGGGRLPLGPARSFQKGRGHGALLSVVRHAEHDSDRDAAREHLLAEARRSNPDDDVDVEGELTTDPYGENPLTDVETRKVLGRAHSAKQQSIRHPDHSVQRFQAGMAHAYGDVASQFGVQTTAGHAPARKRVTPKRAVRKPLKKTRKNPGDLTRPQKNMLSALHRAPLDKKTRKLTLAQASVMKALVRRGLASELKSKWKITAKGTKALYPTKRTASKPHKRAVSKVRRAAKKAPARKKAPAKKKATKKKATKKRAAGPIKFTVALAKGKKAARCTITYPRGVFTNRETALRNIQRELRAKFKHLAKAPQITSCTWKYSDKGRTKGCWHFTAKKKG